MAQPDPRFKTAQWRRIRAQILNDANGLCIIKGPNCGIKASQVDHIRPVADGGAFFDKINLRASCPSCNSRRARIQKDNHGWRRAKTEIILLSGPPGAGLTTKARELMSEGDLLIDYGEIKDALFPVDTPSGSGTPSSRVVRRIRGLLLSLVQRGDLEGVDRVYITSSSPKGISSIPHHSLVHIDPGRESLLDTSPPHLIPWINKYYRELSPTNSPSTPSRSW